MKIFDTGFVSLHTSGLLVGDPVDISGVSTDTRQIQPGELFVALIGPRFDGHDFIADAERAGAAAVLVQREVQTSLPQVIVEDTLRALGELARAWRGQCTVTVVGITGSTGKTTVKQMTAAILAERAPTLATEGNLNNEIGMPLTLLKLRPEHRFAVIEMGASRVGEIAALAAIARPDVGVVTNAGEAHLEGFGGIEGVVEGKGELFAGVVDGGTCVINADQPWSEEWKQRAGVRRKLTFGRDTGNDFHVVDPVHEDLDGLRFMMATPAGNVDVHLPLQGRHNILNALAAAAAAWAAGVDRDCIPVGLAKVRNSAGRMQLERLADGVMLVDDSYNANPVSMRAAINWLVANDRRGWLVMGDMAELGENAAELHEEIGCYAQEMGVERLYSLGALSERASEMHHGGRHFTDVEALADALNDELEPGVTVLFKGSRSARMERVLAALRARRAS